MKRSMSVTIAAILLFAGSLYNAVQSVPLLAQGTATDGDMTKPPFAVTLIVFTISIFGVVASYGIWKNVKWGKVLGLVVSALNILYTLIPLMVAPLPIKLVAAGIIAVYVLIMVLLLRRQSQPVIA